MSEGFDALLERAEAAFAAGELERSVELFAAAERLAEENGDADQADRAFCNRCAVLVELDRASEQIPHLKTILLRSRAPRTRFLAAYTTAIAYDLDGELDRAHSYARRARELAGEIGDPVLCSRSGNLDGTLALRRADFAAAEEAYAVALAGHDGLDGYHRLTAAQVRDNLGYVLMCSGRLDEGVDLCEQARDELEAEGAELYLHQTLQDLCYGYLLQERLGPARTCGERALELAAELDDQLVAKNCLFLLSEVAVRSGDTFAARRLLRELAARYPETAVSEEIIDLFLTTDLTSVVNLRG